jgi:hypothetical protein
MKQQQLRLFRYLRPSEVQVLECDDEYPPLLVHHLLQCLPTLHIPYILHHSYSVEFHVVLHP